MSNTSASGGYLTPVDLPPDQPLEGDALMDFLNSVVAGITGLDADAAIFPAWDDDSPPNLPPKGTSWAATRISGREGEPYAAETHNPGDGTAAGFQGSDTIFRQELLTLECSFYGPNADTNAALWRDGLSVAQNREALTAARFALLSLGEALAVPSLIKQKWLYRVVVPATFRRAIQRTYAVEDLLSAGGTVNSEAITDTFLALKPQT